MSMGRNDSGNARRPVRRGRVWLLLTLPLLAVSVLCDRDYNPFTDETNARALLVAPFSDGDTLDIFSTETVTVVAAVRGLIDAYTVHVDGNRYFSDTTIGDAGAAAPVPHTVTLNVSFYDTGRHELSCVTRRRSGEEVIDRRFCYARSPLRQEKVFGTLGEQVCLATVAVNDRDVKYFWSFGEGLTIESVRPATCQDLPAGWIVTEGRRGMLRVSGFEGVHTSPPSPFDYSLTDYEGPEIICVNEGALRRDTIVTSATLLPFRVQITDRSGGRIYNAKINEAPFDIVRGDFYITSVRLTDTMTEPLRLTVEAADPFSNVTIKRFFIRFDASVVENGGPRITVTFPPRDSMVVSRRQWTLFGRIEYPTADSFAVAMEYRLNGEASGEVQRIGGILSAPWSFDASLRDGINAIEMIARGGDGTAVAERSLAMIRDGDAIDEKPPVIVELQLDGAAIGSRQVTIESGRALLSIIAFDECNGIEAVTINNAGAAAATDGAGYAWEGEIDAAHTAEGSRYTIMVRDGIGLQTEDTLVVRQNRLPSIERPPHPPLPLLIGAGYTDTVTASDDDGDAVRYGISRGPDALAVDTAAGVITWSPAAADRGIDTVSITIQDPFGALLHTYTIRVVDTADLSEPVRFQLTEEDFPRVLEASIDTLRRELTIAAGTGKPPLRFAVSTDREHESALTVENGVLEWTPPSSDTGNYILAITVIDSFNNSASLYPHILVVPPNRPCSLSYTWTGAIGTDGSLDLSAPGLPETLSVTVHDPDGVEIDTFSAQVTLGNSVRKPPVRGGRFELTIDPAAKPSGRDTLRIVVIDKAGHRASLEPAVYYGTPPDIPRLIAPAADSIIRDSAVTFTWEGGDVDRTPVQYTLFLAASDTAFVVRATTVGDLQATVDGLVRAGRRFWQVRASDGKSETAGAIGSFTIDPPLRIRFAVAEDAFPPLLEAGRDSLRVDLAFVQGTGETPFTVSATGSSTTLPVVAATTVSWRPAMADTGVNVLSIVVRDAAGNGDTLRPVIRVVPPDRPPALSLQHRLDTTAQGALDLSGSALPETLLFVISDPDPAAIERFTVHTMLRHTESIERDGTDTLFFVAVDARLAQQWFDTLTVAVSDRGGLSDTLRVVLFYGGENKTAAVVTFNTTSSGVPIAGNAINVPVLLRLDTTDIRFFNEGPIRNRLRFYKENGRSLPYEIEQWDTVAGTATVWLLMDTVYANRSTQSVVVKALPFDDDNSSGPSVFGDFAGVWHMNRETTVMPAATYIDDASGNSNTGTCINMPAASAAGGIAGNAAAIDSNRYVTIGNRPDLAISGAVTVEAWVWIAPDNLQTTDYQPIINKGDYAYFIDIDSDSGWIQFGIGDAGGWWYVCPADNDFQRSRWYHVVGRFDGSEVALFIDGNKQSTTWTGGPIPTSIDPLQIGHSNDRPYRWFRGSIDEVRIAARTRSDSWIRICYEGVRPGSKLLSIKRSQ